MPLDSQNTWEANVWRAVVENAPDVILQVDLQGTIVFINQTAAQAVVGQQWLTFVPEPRHELMRNTLAHVLSGGAPLSYETEGIDPETGAEALFSCRIGSTSRDGVVDGAVIIARDITQQRQGEADVKAMSVQLLQNQKLAAVGQLAAGVAHEINTPVQYVNDNGVFFERTFKKLFDLIDALRPVLDGTGDVPAAALDVARARARSCKLDYLAREMPKALAQSQDGLRRVAGIVAAMKDFAHPSGGEMAPVVLRDLLETTAIITRNEWRYVADLEVIVADAMRGESGRSPAGVRRCPARRSRRRRRLGCRVAERLALSHCCTRPASAGARNDSTATGPSDRDRQRPRRHLCARLRPRPALHHR